MISVPRKPSFTSDVLTVATGSTLAQIIAFAGAPILTRFYGPETFGLLEVFLSTAAIVSVFSALRYDFAIVLPASDQDAQALLVISYASLIATAGLVATVTWLAPGWIFARVDMAIPSAVQWLLPAFLLAEGSLRISNKWNNRKRLYRTQAIGDISNAVITFFSRLLAALMFSATAPFLILGGVLGSVVASCLVSRSAFAATVYILRERYWFTRVRALLVRYHKFPLYTGWSALMYTTAIQLPALMLFRYFDPATVGFYALGERLIRRPLNVVGQAIAQVFLRRASEAHRDGELSLVVRKVHNTLAHFGLFPALLLSVCGDELMQLFLGTPWRQAGVFAQILSLQLFFQFLSTPMGRLFYVLERQEANTLFSGCLLATRFLALTTGPMLGGIYTTLLLLAMSSTMVFLGFSYWICRAAGVNAGSWFAPLLRAFARSIVLLVPWVALRLYGDLPTLYLLTLILPMAILYLMWTVSTEPDVKEIVLRVKRR